jgi:hypothetical protein
VAAFQVGRTDSGGGANIGYATSKDRGATWIHGFLPGITSAGGGSSNAVTDAAVAYDPKRGVWLIASTPLDPPPGIRGNSVVVNRSTDGGITWSSPTAVALATGSADFDKSWVVCDGTPTSPHYGNCYAQWDDFGDVNRIRMSTSTDGGLTWGPAKTTADHAQGLGGQPVVQPNGTVVVPMANIDETAIAAFRSTDGGATWSTTRTIDDADHHTPPGGMRAGPLPSAEVDGKGRVYVAWEDCRFRRCGANDIVLTSSADGRAWTRVARVPIDPLWSGVEHFVPGLGVDRATSGSRAHLALSYHYIPNRSCTAQTCSVRVGFIDSLDGGRTWSETVALAPAMRPVWLAPTGEGYMTGDYISTSFVRGAPRPLFAAAGPPQGAKLDEAIYAARPALAAARRARRLANLRIRPFRFAARRSGPSVAAVRGAAVTYDASRPGATRFWVARGVRHRCGTTPDGRKRYCRTWTRLDGHFDRRDAKGHNRFVFTGRMGGALKHGLYRLVARPHDPDRPPAKTSRARFRIVRAESRR